MKRETPLALYKGLGAVVTGIVPKMAIRFSSFESYKKLLANKETGAVSGQATFLGEYSQTFVHLDLFFLELACDRSIYLHFLQPV